MTTDGLDAPTLWRLERIASPALAPDGRRAVCTVTRPDLDANQGRTHLWMLDTARCAPRRLTTCGDKDGQPAWSPRGDRVAFVARRAGDDAPQLYVIGADGGEARRVTSFAPGVQAFRWCPDGRRIVFAAWVWPGGAAVQARHQRAWKERKETGCATSEAFYRYWDDLVPPGRALHLLLLDVDRGRVRDLFEGSGLELPRHGNVAFDVHPDGRRVAFAHDPAPVPVLGQPLRIAELDFATRRVRPLVADPAWDFDVPRYSPDGRQLAFAAAHVGRHHRAPYQLAVADGREGRGWRVLDARHDREIDGPPRWQPDGRALVFPGEDGGRRHLWRCTLDGRTERLHEGGWVQDFDLAGGTLLVAMDSARHPVRLLADGRRIERFNDAVLARVPLGEVRDVTVTGACGRPVQMWLTFPPGFDARRRHPVMHVIHGGPAASVGDGWSWRWNPHVFAQAGQVVAQVNYHGSSGFGFDFKASLVGRQGELELQDLEAATDWLRAQRWADARRVTAAGGSYGGFLVAWMNGHVAPGRYQAYVCHAGVFDRIATFAADSYPERPKDLAARYWDDMPRVLAQSPHAFAHAMHTPTLVVHGARDFRVPDCNGLAYYNTLKARGVDARLLWFPDEHHWIMKPRNSLQWYREVLAWIGRHTAGARRPRSAAAPP